MQCYDDDQELAASGADRSASALTCEEPVTTPATAAAPGPVASPEAGSALFAGMYDGGQPAAGPRVEALRPDDPAVLDAEARQEAARLAGKTPEETAQEERDRRAMMQDITGDPNASPEMLISPTPPGSPDCSGFQWGGKRSVDAQTGAVTTSSTLAGSICRGPDGTEVSLNGNDGTVSAPGRGTLSLPSFQLGARAGAGGVGLNAEASGGEHTGAIGDTSIALKGPSASVKLGAQPDGTRAYGAGASAGDLQVQGKGVGVTVSPISAGAELRQQRDGTFSGASAGPLGVDVRTAAEERRRLEELRRR